jgi:hypothetical protein
LHSNDAFSEDGLQSTIENHPSASHRGIPHFPARRGAGAVFAPVTPLRKVGEKLGENAQVATVVPSSEPSATFKIPPNYKFEIGVAMPLGLGERLVTCQVADWEPEKLRITCPPDSGVTEGAAVTWQIP